MKFDKSSQNFLFVVIGRYSGAGLQAIFYFIFASFLIPEEYGKLSYFIAISGTFSIVALFGLNSSATIFQAKQERSLVNQINTLSFITAGIAAIILIPFNIYAAILSLAISFFIMNQHNLLGLKKYKIFMFNSILKGSSIIILPLLFYFAFDLPGILIGLLIGNFIASYDYLKNLSLKIDSFSQLRKKFGILFHNFGVDLSSKLPKNIDKLLIMPILGFTNVGIYQLNLQILLALELLPSSLHSYLLSEESSGKKHQKVILYVIIASTALTFISIIISPYFINQFFPKYSDGIFSLQILLVSLIPLSLIAILSAKLQVLESKKVGFSAPIRIGSLLILIATIGNWYGLIGLSAAVLISVILHVIFLAFLFKSTQNRKKLVS